MNYGEKHFFANNQNKFNILEENQCYQNFDAFL